jgi:hypothetical protein
LTIRRLASVPKRDEKRKRMNGSVRQRKPRKTTDGRGSFPYADPRVPFILIAGGEEIDAEGTGMNWGCSVETKLGLVQLAEETTAEILTVWPGKTRSDVFIIDDLAEARAALEMAS